MSEAGRALIRERVRSHLIVERSPRRDMAIIVALSASAAFLSSVGLLTLGVHALVLRYPLAASIGYAFFLLALRLWVLWREPRVRQPVSVDVQLDSLVDIAPSLSPASESFHGFGGGGGFSGAGATGTIDGPEPASPAIHVTTDSAADIDVDWDMEGLVVIPLLLIAAVLGAASLYIVIAAPTLFAELVVDALIAAGVYRRVRRLPARHWFVSSLAHTWRPFLILLVTTLIASMILQSLAPTADSIGDVIRPLLSHSAA